jgi:hypothetical protein
MRKCRHCGGKYKIVGTGYYGDTVEAECTDCGDYIEVESDGLGFGGLEWVEGRMAEMKQKGGSSD